MTTPRKCLVCDAPIRGRIDKKFCNDTCRNTYNNNNKRQKEFFERKVNAILRKNKRILAQLTPKEKSKTTKEELLFNGFNFYYFTNIYKTKQGKTYYFVYDYGYLELENEDFALVRKKEYVK
ncbi:MAG: DUF2116 family Zn-ribbon domain-containing protein [Flavobacteriales bacterium]|jgi:predicted nucleic acid-binding Zn ribbon protein|nr:DUF2116 family Zn-ribbon domain-containing protein [Flavobacteriales bacterium]